MIGEFLTWWGQQLRSLWPRAEQARRRDGLSATLAQGGRQLQVNLRRRGRALDLGAFPLTDAGRADLAARLGKPAPAAELIVPAGSILERTVTLPLAAERDPARVLSYEMDRFTPFTADQIYWSWSVEARDRTRGECRVKIAMVVKAQLEAAVAALAAAGARVSAVVSDDGKRIGLTAAKGGRLPRAITAALALACAVLAATAVAIPFVQQSREAARVEARIADLRPAVGRVEALRREQEAASTAVDVLAKARARYGDALAILAAVTTILPDDTSLTDLSLRERVLTLNGQSAAAARLIPALAADPAMRDPVFTAPVTHNDMLRADVFAIRVHRRAAGPRPMSANSVRDPVIPC